jgi:hypothetical protein
MPRAILSAAYSMMNLCSPSTMCGPFCSVPAVPTITLVVPAATRSRTSAQVSSSISTVSGGFAAGIVAGASAGRCAARLVIKRAGKVNRTSRARVFMGIAYNLKLKI